MLLTPYFFRLYSFQNHLKFTSQAISHLILFRAFKIDYSQVFRIELSHCLCRTNCKVQEKGGSASKLFLKFPCISTFRLFICSRYSLVKCNTSLRYYIEREKGKSLALIKRNNTLIKNYTPTKYEKDVCHTTDLFKKKMKK